MQFIIKIRGTYETLWQHTGCVTLIWTEQLLMKRQILILWWNVKIVASSTHASEWIQFDAILINVISDFFHDTDDI
jgi:hypothetical protein